jgi:hypothetical protein
LIDWFLNFLLGQGTDKPATKWDAMFLPSEAALSAQDFEYALPGGNKTKLVSKTETIHTAIGRPPVPAAPPKSWPCALLAGLLIAGMLALCMVLDTKHIKAGKTARLLLQGLFGCFLGLTGSLLFFMAFFTNHDYAFNNLNMLIANPLLLAALPLGITVLTADNYIKETIAIHIIKILWTAIFLSGAASTLLSAFSYQQNATTLDLALPSSFVLSLFPRWLARFGRYFL